MDINSHEVNKIVHIKSLHGSQMYIQSQAHTRLPCQPQDFSKSDEEGPHSPFLCLPGERGIRGQELPSLTQNSAQGLSGDTMYPFPSHGVGGGGTMVLPLLAEVKKRRGGKKRQGAGHGMACKPQAASV